MALELVVLWAGRRSRDRYEELCEDYRERISHWVPVRETIVRSRKLQNGTIILFAGADSAGRAVAVVYREAEVTKEDGTKSTAFLLRLSYVEKPSDPDIYKLEPGTF